MRIAKVIAAAVVAVSLAACASKAQEPSTHLQVNMVEFTFTPSDFTVPAGQEITLDAANNGATVHNFIIMKSGTTIGDSFGTDDAPNVYWQVDLQPGTSKTVTFTAPSEPGDYEVVCSTDGHYIAGMVARLHVVAP